MSYQAALLLQTAICFCLLLFHALYTRRLMEEFRRKVYFDMMDYFITQKRQSGDRPSQKEPPSRRSEPGKKQNRLRLISTPDDF